MARRWDGTRPNLAERSGLPPAAGADGDAEQARPRPVGTRHCWVAGPYLPGRHAGLLVEWRREPASARWLARVVYTVDQGGSPVLVEEWVPAEHLTPAS